MWVVRLVWGVVDGICKLMIGVVRFLMGLGGRWELGDGVM